MPSSSPQQPLIRSRDAALDLIKWLALLTMLIDHLRHAWPALYFLYAVSYTHLTLPTKRIV